MTRLRISVSTENGSRYLNKEGFSYDRTVVEAYSGTGKKRRPCARRGARSLENGLKPRPILDLPAHRVYRENRPITQLVMTTYVYETIPSKKGEKPRHYELKQAMKDAPLTKHPETGEPIRRVLTGGFGVLSSKPSSAKSGPAPSPRRGGCGGGACGCH